MKKSTLPKHALSFAAALLVSIAILIVAGLPSSGPETRLYAQIPIKPIEPAPSTSYDARTPISSLPYEISEPGSYFLTQNLTVVTADFPNAISVKADDVTIDLNGFRLEGGGTGEESPSYGIDGISNRNTSVPRVYNVEIRNGTISGFDCAINLNGSSFRVVDVRVSRCCQTGIDLFGDGLVTGCTITDSRTGISAYGGLVVENVLGNIARGGIAAGMCQVVGNYVSDCSRDPEFDYHWGIRAVGSMVRHNKVHANDRGIILIGGVAEENVITGGRCGVYAEGDSNFWKDNRLSGSDRPWDKSSGATLIDGGGNHEF